MNLTAVLVTGLFAGGVSCAAVQGGLLTGLISRQRAAAVGIPVTAGGRSRAAGTDAPPHASPWHRLGDDIAPVAGFLAGKLVSHAALGALLGALGGAVQLSIGARTTLQILAGALIIVFGLAQLGVPGFRGVVIEPPQAWMRVVVSGPDGEQLAFAFPANGISTQLWLDDRDRIIRQVLVSPNHLITRTFSYPPPAPA